MGKNTQSQGTDNIKNRRNAEDIQMFQATVQAVGLQEAPQDRTTTAKVAAAGAEAHLLIVGL